LEEKKEDKIKLMNELLKLISIDSNQEVDEDLSLSLKDFDIMGLTQCTKKYNKDMLDLFINMKPLVSATGNPQSALLPTGNQQQVYKYIPCLSINELDSFNNTVTMLQLIIAFELQTIKNNPDVYKLMDAGVIDMMDIEPICCQPITSMFFNMNNYIQGNIYLALELYFKCIIHMSSGFESIINDEVAYNYEKTQNKIIKNGGHKLKSLYESCKNKLGNLITYLESKGKNNDISIFNELLSELNDLKTIIDSMEPNDKTQPTFVRLRYNTYNPELLSFRDLQPILNLLFNTQLKIEKIQCIRQKTEWINIFIAYNSHIFSNETYKGNAIQSILPEVLTCKEKPDNIDYLLEILNACTLNDNVGYRNNDYLILPMNALYFDDNKDAVNNGIPSMFKNILHVGADKIEVIKENGSFMDEKKFKKYIFDNYENDDITLTILSNKSLENIKFLLKSNSFISIMAAPFQHVNLTYILVHLYFPKQVFDPIVKIKNETDVREFIEKYYNISIETQKQI